MQDTCVVRTYTGAADGWGNPTPTYTAGAAIACGVEHGVPEEWQDSNQVAQIDAVLRLPIGTVIAPEDLVNVTYRYGELLGTAQVFEVVGPVRQGPSGVRAGARLRVGAD